MIYLLPILAVLLSFVFVFFAKPKKKEGLRLLLAFSGAFLLALTIFELFPEVYQSSDPKIVGIFIMLGILLQIFLEFFSKGAEHGHIHIDGEKTGFPMLLFLSLCLHAFLEGLPIEENKPLIYGVLIHKIPVALILGIFLLTSKIRLSYAVTFMVIFSLMTPIGSYFAANMDFVSSYKVYINALIIGVFLHISTVILFESSEGHTFNLRKMMVIIFGVVSAYFL